MIMMTDYGIMMIEANDNWWWWLILTANND